MRTTTNNRPVSATYGRALRGVLGAVLCGAGALALGCGGDVGSQGQAGSGAGGGAGGDAGGKLVIQYDCIPNYANWGGVTQAYLEKTGVRVPPDMKGSSKAMAALEKERDAPRADCAYYSGAIGFAAAAKGLHQPYKPARWDEIPAALKDPDGLWWTVHTAHIAILVNTEALGGKPVPRSFADLLKPEYAGMIVYDDPTATGTAFTFVYGVGFALGGGLDEGFAYLEQLQANVMKNPPTNSQNELMRGEVPIWINADGNGLKAKADGAPVEVVIPAEGAIAMPLVMGMVQGAPRPEATRAYLDWLLTDEAQALFAKAFFRPIMPTALDAEAKRQFPPDAAYAKRVVVPLADMAANEQAVKARWTREIAGR